MEFLLPPEISPLFAGVIVVAAFFTSALNVAFGLGGGVALLAIMAQGMPVAALIPVHGVAQLGSNLSRAFLMRQSIDWKPIRWMVLGGVVGILLGATFVMALPDGILKLCLAAFILWSAYAGKPSLSARPSAPMLVAGGIGASFATMFFGATGPLVMAVLNTCGLPRKRLVGTHAAMMCFQHTFKIAAFLVLSFQFMPWLPLIAAMVAFAWLGTVFGYRIFSKMPDAAFRVGFKIVMTLLAVQTAASGLSTAL